MSFSIIQDKMSLGKIDPGELQCSIFSHLGADDNSLELGPAIGGDCAVIRMDDCFLAFSSDPITGTKDRIGKFAVDINANDVASFGANPRWLTLTYLVPSNFDTEDITEVASQVSREAKRLGISVVGGHTERVQQLSSTILTGAVIGVADRFLDPDKVQYGDRLILIGWAGQEGTAILADSYRDQLLQAGLPETTLQNAVSLTDKLSIVAEARRATPFARIMHDPTEGGILGAVAEMSTLISKEILVEEENIPIRSETKRICETLNLEPLRLISSGSLLVIASEENVANIMDELSGYQAANVIGEVRKNASSPIPRPDELWKYMEKN